MQRLPRFVCTFRIGIGIALQALMLAMNYPVSAQTCLGPVTGVPANYTAPDWVDEPGGPGACESGSPPAGCDYYQSLNDPRWVGAGSVTFGDGVSNILEARGLQDVNYVYLSFRMSHTTVGTTDNSQFYFAIQDPNASDTPTGILVVGVNLKENLPAADQQNGAAFQLSGWNAVAAGTPPLATLPKWLTGTLRVWTNMDDPVNGDANSWAVQVQIPRSSLNITGSTFKLWFQSLNATPTNPTAVLAWPTTAMITQQSSQNVYPDPSTWQTYQFSTGPSDPVCATAGVSLLLTSIGTYNDDPGTSNPDPQLILFQASGSSAPPPTNVFFAYPQNNTGNAIGPNQILATFRIADWGSNPNDWEAGVNSNVLWSIIPGGANVPNSAAIPNGTIANKMNQNTFPWIVSGADLTAFQTGARRSDNCLLVQLAGVSSGTPIVFASNSVRRNMTFEHASSIEKKATITIKGLPPIAPDGRDVYIWIETLNMPSVVPTEGPLRQLQTTVPGQVGGQSGAAHGSTNIRETGYVPSRPGKSIPVPEPPELQRMLLAGEVTQAQIEAVVPTYIVHAYHDTGTSLRLGGIDRPVLTEQGSFGYYLSHTGTLTGWEHALVGYGFTLEQLAPNFYRIKKMANDAAVTVITRITAREDRWIWLKLRNIWWVVLISIIVIFLIVFSLRRKGANI